MSQNKEIIRLGLPKGSLNSERGNTNEVFTNAGYETSGYEPGKESDKNLSIVNDPEIVAFLTRPQSVPIELSRRLLDIAITGEDWFQEEQVSRRRNGVYRVGDLEYGRTRLVIAVPEKSPYESLSDFFEAFRGRERPILCFTEYVNLTRRAFMRNKAYREIFGDMAPFVQYRGLTRRGRNRGIEILGSDGITEGFIRKGADIIVDNTQSGRTLKKDYHLRELEQIMESSAGLYAGPSCVGWKEDKAREIYEMLYGAVVGKNFFDVKFNISMTRVEKVRRYLKEAGLCADEPTIVLGEDYAQVNIFIPRKTFPGERQKLARNYGATSFVRNEVKQFIK